MIRGNTLLWRNVAEHSFLQVIVAAHSLASFAFLEGVELRKVSWPSETGELQR
jgi:hypothetical protein